MYIWGKGRAAGRVGSEFLSAIAGRVGSTFRRVRSGRVQDKWHLDNSDYNSLPTWYLQVGTIMPT